MLWTPLRVKASSILSHALTVIFTPENPLQLFQIVQEETSGDITYYVKGADVALSRLLESAWLSAECSQLAADGLRTLLVAKRSLTLQQYLDFEVIVQENSGAMRYYVTGAVEATGVRVAQRLVQSAGGRRAQDSARRETELYATAELGL